MFTIEKNRFGVEPEVTAKIAEVGLVVYEVGISCAGGSYADDKKIGWREGIRALFCIVACSPPVRKFRVRRLSLLVSRFASANA